MGGLGSMLGNLGGLGGMLGNAKELLGNIDMSQISKYIYAFSGKD